MLAGKPHARFLLRASALVILLLVVWWFVLLNPLLLVLKGSAELMASLIPGAGWTDVVTETPSGDWSVHVPLEVPAPPGADSSGALQIHSIHFDMRRSDVVAFTFSLPVYWAIVLAASGIRRSIRPLLVGTPVVVAMETVLFLVFAEISARNAAAQMFPAPQPQGGLAKWFLQFGEYMVVNVLPYIAPFVIAVALHRDLRAQIFLWAQPASAVAGDASRRKASASTRGR